MKGKSHFLTRAPKKTKDQLKIEHIEEEKEEAYSKVETITRDLELLNLKKKEYEMKQRGWCKHR